MFSLALVALMGAGIAYPEREEDLERFPGHGESFWESTDRKQEQVADEHYQFCRTQRESRIAPWIDWVPLEEEAYHVWRAWMLLREARGSSWLPCGKLIYLRGLRQLIGEEWYQIGRMPVPQTWHRGFIP